MDGLLAAIRSWGVERVEFIDTSSSPFIPTAPCSHRVKWPPSRKVRLSGHDIDRKRQGEEHEQRDPVSGLNGQRLSVLSLPLLEDFAILRSIGV